MKERNYNIDFLRGIAALWIIVIHTAFWSGQKYLPYWFSNLTLFLDVPVFIYISGVSYNYVNSIIKSIKSILIQWKKWLFFMLFFIPGIFIVSKNHINTSDILNWLFYSFPNRLSMPVVGGSIWFVTMYISVLLFCSIIIGANNYFEKDTKKRQDNLINIMFLLLLIFGYSSLAKTNFFISSYTSMYSIIFIFGYITSKYKIDYKKMLCYFGINLFLLILVFGIRHLSIKNLQASKFPPSLPYFIASGFSITLFWFLKDYLKIKKDNIINYVGKNAIFFYYAQGIGASVLFKALKIIPINNKIILFILMLLLNAFVTICIAIFLEKAYNYLLKHIKIDKYLNKIKPEKQ